MIDPIVALQELLKHDLALERAKALCDEMIPAVRLLKEARDRCELNYHYAVPSERQAALDAAFATLFRITIGNHA